MSLRQQQELETDYLMRSYQRKPVEFVRGKGILLYDDTGAEYLDFLAGIGAVSVGHANPRVTRAIQEQAAKLLHVGNYYYVEGRGELAKKISALLNNGAVGDGGGTVGDGGGPEQSGTSRTPSPTVGTGDSGSLPFFWKTFFANSGAEAVEGAIKIARKYGMRYLEGADMVVSARRSFHGRTLATLAATGQDSKRDSFKPIPEGFVHVELNDIQALRAMLNQGFGGRPVCAVLLECIQGEGGVYPCTEEYLLAARQLTEEAGILLMIDEIQTGFYRTGTYPFAFQHYGITPDVVTLAKGLGAGVPIGAVAARGKAADIFEPGDHGSTFGGSPLAIVAANATLDELEATEAGQHVAEVGSYLQERLKDLPFVAEIRGRGLMVGLELNEAIAESIVTKGLKAGLVLNNIGPHILRFLPPLVCTKKDVDVLIKRLQTIMERL
ncbi:MAG: aspartate aminotransferase family protein [Coriobacteriales bacterium]|jgi:acetylornithine aminotransferase|nr:aspartate aminotransferase family protein [Coriobacteriales bacterium]